MHTIYLFWVVLIFSVSAPLNSQALDARALELISDFVEKQCSDYNTTGERSDVHLKGQAEAKLSKLLSDLVDLGVEGAAEINKSEYSNVLQKDLASELKDVRACRRELSNKLIDQLSAAPITPEADLSGAWRYSAECPDLEGTGKQLYTGDVIMQRIGEKDYKGRVTSNFGDYGLIQSTVSGSNVVLQVTWADGTQSVGNGVMSQDGQQWTATDSDSCYSSLERKPG